MSFILEAVGHIIRRNMEDPKDREEYWDAHIDNVDSKRKKVKEAINQPVKPFGFWNSAPANAKYNTNLDPGINTLPGRAKTIDD
ncbi:g9763 [Coccomyxa elongata]